MKLIKGITIVLMIVLSTNVFASHFGEYTTEQMQLTNKLFDLCPKEVSKLLKQSYTQITAGNYIGGQTPDGISTTYNFTFKQTLPAPSFRQQMWALTADEIIKNRPASEHEPLDRPGYTKEVTCKVKNVITPPANMVCTPDFNRWGHPGSCICPANSKYNGMNGFCEGIQ